jgi:hypothetical protein
MKKFFSLLKTHYGAVILAALIAVFMYLPQFWFARDLGTNYQGVYFAATDSEEYYAARIAEIYDGHLSLSNPYHAEYKNLPYVQPPLPEMVYAGLGMTVGWDRVQATLYGSRLISPFLLTLVVYGFIFSLYRSRLLSLGVSAMILLGLNFLMDPRAILGVFRGQTQVYQGLPYSRPVSPQIHSIFFFSYLWLFWLWLSGRKKVFLFFSAVVLGLAFYAYFYLWSFLLASLGLLALYFIWQKDWPGLKSLLLHLLVALLLAVPYFLNVYHFLRLDFAASSAHLQGLVSSHEFIFSTSLFLGILLFVFLSVQIEKRLRVFLVVLLLSGFLALNQQVITGRELHAAHYHWYFNLPLIGIALALAVSSFFHLAERKRILAPLIFLGILFLFIGAYFIQRGTYLNSKDYFAQEQRYAPLFSWLNQNTQKDSVVLAYSQRLSDILPVYTHNNVLTSVRAGLSATPYERVEYDFFLPLYLQGLMSSDALKYFRDNPQLSANLIGGVANRLTYGCRTCYPDSENQKLADGYTAFAAQGKAQLLNKYRLDYVVNDRASDTWSKDFFSGFEKLVEVGDFIIYKKI